MGFDIGILILILLLGTKGLITGAYREWFSLLGIIGGIFVASRISSDMGNMIAGFININNDDTKLLVGFLVTFLFIWLIVNSIANLVEKNIIYERINNKYLGFIFATSKIFLVFSIIFFTISSIPQMSKKIEKYTNNSLLYPILIQTGNNIIKLKVVNEHSK